MPLVSSTTNLKSLRYGKDRPFGGSSGQPFVQKDIKNLPDSAVGNTGGRDFLLRGGSLITEKTADDVTRLTKLLINSPLSAAFNTAKFNLGTRLNVDILGGSNIKRTKEPGLNQGLYLPFNTIGQAAVTPTGTHLEFNLDIPKYLNLVSGENGIDQTITNPEVNRLVALRGNKITTGADDLELYSYSGGPGAKLGLGKTILSRTQKTLNYSSQWNLKNPGNTVITFDQDLLGNLKLVTPGSNQIYGPYAITNFTDFRQTIKDKGLPGSENLASSDYLTFNRRSTFGLGDYSDRGATRNDPYSSRGAFGTSKDTMAQLGLLYSSESPNNDIGVDEDFIDFHIGVVDNDDPSKKTWVQFRAFLNDFTDNYSANWTGYQYVGRGEQFYSYGGFGREISLSFDVAVQSAVEQKAQYEKLNYLASTLAPDYSTGGFMRGSIIYLTVGDYLVDVPGVLKGLTYTTNMAAGWEIGRNADGTRSDIMKQLPFLINVSGFSFTPIHNFIPQKSKVISTPDGTGIDRLIPTKFINYMDGDVDGGLA